MLSTKDVTAFYEILLTTEFMKENAKIDLRIPRKNVLLLSKLIELGLSVKNEHNQGGLLTLMDTETVEAIRSVAQEILRKAGLTEMNDKLLALQSTK